MIPLRVSSPFQRAAFAGAAFALAAGCTRETREEPEAAALAKVEPREPEPDDAAAPAEVTPAPDASFATLAEDGLDASRGASDAGPRDATGGADAGPRCPKGMLFVGGRFCPKVERNCLRSEVGASNLTICQEFEEGVTECTEPEEERAFCIDEYEYPDERGAHPTWMVTWYDAQATCLAKEKRLCYASEWTRPARAQARRPFPTGGSATRPPATWTTRSSSRASRRSSPPDGGYDAALPELLRLDQSVPCGSMARCVSGFGVHDLPGNFDEWVINDETSTGEEVGSGPRSRAAPGAT